MPTSDRPAALKVGFVNAVYQAGGAETVTHDLRDGCARAGLETRLYVARGRSYPREPGVVPLYSRLMSRLQHSRVQPLAERLAPRLAWTDRAFSALADGWPDLIHLHSFHGEYARVESLAHLALRKPLIWTLHGHWAITGGCDHPVECDRYQDSCGQCPLAGVWPISAADDTAEQLRIKRRYLAGVPFHVVAPSRALADRISGSQIGRRWLVHHLPNGVSEKAFGNARKHDPAFRRALGLDPDATIVLVAIRDFREGPKGFPLIREALMSVPASGTRVQVMLVGDGSEGAVAEIPRELRPMAWGFVESRTKIAELFEASDIFLFASRAETFPCVVLEAMASGCCVIATPTSGVTEQIEDGRTGIIAASITGAALARALAPFLEDGEARTRVGGAAREHVIRAFPLERMIDAYLMLYREIAAAS